MARNGSGSYSVPITFTPNTRIRSADFNTDLADIGSEITNSVARDGQSPMLAQLDMGGFEIINVADGTTSDSAISRSQMDANTTSTLAQVFNTAGSFTVNLTVAKATPYLILSKAASGQAAIVNGATAGVSRWQMQLGNATAEAGSNVGSDWSLDAFGDSGTLLYSPITVARSTGVATFSSAPIVGTAVTGTSTTAAASTAFVQQELAAGTRRAAAWGNIAVSGGVPSIAASYNVASIVDTGVGVVTVNLTTPMSNTNYAVLATVYETGASRFSCASISSTSQFVIRCFGTGAAADPLGYAFAIFGT